MTKDIDIRVAKILESDKIVINKGSKDRIDSNMEFLVFEEGEEIKDPVSGESLGVLENPKGTFKPLHIQEKMCILISNTKRPSTLLSMAGLSEINVERALLKSIKINDKVKITNRI